MQSTQWLDKNNIKYTVKSYSRQAKTASEAAEEMGCKLEQKDLIQALNPRVGDFVVE
jgi:hypothetical protein